MTIAEASTAAPPLDWRGDLYSHALRTGRGPLYLRRHDGWMLPLDVERWCGAVDEIDGLVVNRCRGAVLDIGCGPGRFAAALRHRRHRVLGIDVSPVAVERTRDNGAPALHLSVYDRLPGEGSWDTALLMDGNIGIGGDPVALLRRITHITAPGGLLITEVANSNVDERLTVHVDNGAGRRGGRFAWARIGAEALARLTSDSNWRIVEHWSRDDRAFCALRSGRAQSPTAVSPDGQPLE